MTVHSVPAKHCVAITPPAHSAHRTPGRGRPNITSGATRRASRTFRRVTAAAAHFSCSLSPLSAYRAASLQPLFSRPSLSAMPAVVSATSSPSASPAPPVLSAWGLVGASLLTAGVAVAYYAFKQQQAAAGRSSTRQPQDSRQRSSNGHVKGARPARSPRSVCAVCACRVRLCVRYFVRLRFVVCLRSSVVC